MSSDFYTTSIVPFAPIIIKICRAYTNTQEDFEDYYQEVCLQIWRSHGTLIEATWREGFLNPDALVAPKVNDLYTRKSRHIVDRSSACRE